MDAKTKQILNNIKYRAKVTPMMVEAGDMVFVLDYVSPYSVSGHVCGITGNYRSKFKQARIQKTKDGERYIMANRIRFNADNIMPCEISREIVENELTATISMKKTVQEIKQNGQDVGYAIENQDFYIQNLKNYLEQNPA